jgi:hypothetical protein
MTRLAAVLILPAIYWTTMWLLFEHERSMPGPRGPSMVGIIMLAFLPSVAIYLVALLGLALVRRLPSYGAGELAAVALMSTGLIPLFMLVAYAGITTFLGRTWGDRALFGFVPFVPPAVAVWFAFQLLNLWRRHPIVVARRLLMVGATVATWGVVAAMIAIPFLALDHRAPPLEVGWDPHLRGSRLWFAIGCVGGLCAAALDGLRSARQSEDRASTTFRGAMIYLVPVTGYLLYATLSFSYWEWTDAIPRGIAQFGVTGAVSALLVRRFSRSVRGAAAGETLTSITAEAPSRVR